MFAAEEAALYPLMDAALRRTGRAAPKALVPVQRLSTQNGVLDLLSAARKTRDVATGETPARIAALRYALDRAGEAVLAYFSASETALPPLLRAGLRRGPRDAARAERRFFDALLRRPHGGTLGALLLAGLDRKAARAAFLERNMKSEKERGRFRDHVRLVEARHMRLAPAFEEAAARYERVFSVHLVMDDDGEEAEAERAYGLRLLGDVDLNAE